MVCPVCISNAIAANIPVISAAVSGLVAAKVSMAPKPQPKPQKPVLKPVKVRDKNNFSYPVGISKNLNRENS